MLKCSYSSCDKVYKYESERKRHQKSHFPQFDCKVCLKKFSFLSALKRHQKQHERKGSVQCSECERSFRDVTLLKRHIRYSHNGSYCCSECKTVFRSNLALRAHARIHMPKTERRFRCTHEGCSKTFNFAHHLRHHELTHSTAKPHYCNVCRKGFIQAHHLKTHLKSHCIDNWLSCTNFDCDKQFKSKSAWNKHIGSHTKHFDVNFKDTKLCAVCGGLISQQQYIYHNRQCTFEKLGRCNDKIEELVMNNNETEVMTTVKKSHELCRLEISPVNIKINECSKINDSKVFSRISVDVKSHSPVTKYTSSISDINYNINEKNGCSSCSCANKQALRGPADLTGSSPFQPQYFNEAICKPDIEYCIDGIVKIRETFDADILTVKQAHKENSRLNNEANYFKYVPINSCKAFLGNCIVSEDGTIGEGCLCAKMIVDEQQISAQEIDELTPNPT